MSPSLFSFLCPAEEREMMDQLWWVPGVQTGSTHHKNFLCVCDTPNEKLRAMSHCGKGYWYPIVFSWRFTARLAHFSLDVHYDLVALWNEPSWTLPELWIEPLSKSVFLDHLEISFISHMLHPSCLPWEDLTEKSSKLHLLLASFALLTSAERYKCPLEQCILSLFQQVVVGQTLVTSPSWEKEIDFGPGIVRNILWSLRGQNAWREEKVLAEKL